MKTMLLDTLPAIEAFLTSLGDCSGQPPRLYMDLEGNKLSRHGTVSLLTCLVEPQRTVYLVDVTNLGERAFSIADANGRTLKDVLQSREILKVFFDIRNDSDALFSHFGVQMAGVEDLQLMELASRHTFKKYVAGLSKCIDLDSALTATQKHEWSLVKEAGLQLFAPERGGSYAVFDRRPLPPEMAAYCAQDVTGMPGLRRHYLMKLSCDAWWAKIEDETTARIQGSQSSSYNPNGNEKRFGPSAWMYWSPTPAQRSSRTRLDRLVQLHGTATASQ